MKTIRLLYSLQSIVLVLAVILGGAHAKDVVKAETYKKYDPAKVHLDDGLSKVSSELHNHIDKQTFKTLYHGGDVQYQADRRSLWHLEKDARSWRLEFKVGASIWLRMAAAKLML